MSAFWSGTDQNDDRNKTYYTGVVGKLNLPKYEVVLRFNYNELKHVCELDELFDIAEEEVEVPTAWLDSIQTHTYSGGKHKGKGKKPGSTPDFDPDDDNYYRGIGMGYGGSAQDWEHFLRERDNTLGKPNPSSNQLRLEDLVGGSTKESFQRETRNFQEMRLNPKTGLMEPLGNQEEMDAQETSSEEIPRYIKKAKGVNTQDPCYMDYLTAQYGEETANGYDQAAAGLMDIDGCDEALLDLIREAYSRLTTSAQMELAQTGL